MLRKFSVSHVSDLLTPELFFETFIAQRYIDTLKEIGKSRFVPELTILLTL